MRIESLMHSITTNRNTIAVQHMTIYWSILEKTRGSKLRLTRMDDEIHDHFKNSFPDFDPRETLDEGGMKSKAGKEKWRQFLMAYEKLVDDYNFGTMIRTNPKFEYGEKETIFGQHVIVWPGVKDTDVKSGTNAVLCN